MLWDYLPSWTDFFGYNIVIIALQSLLVSAISDMQYWLERVQLHPSHPDLHLHLPLAGSETVVWIIICTQSYETMMRVNCGSAERSVSINRSNRFMS